jgi:cytochrome c peroxidase
MAAPKELIEQRINSIPEYVELFNEAYGKSKKISFKQIADTIAVFERTLVTPSRYDDFLNGKKDALSTEEREGLEIFIDKGCVTCHKGMALGGEMKPFELRDKYKHRAIGGFIGNSQKMIKVPTLRNITETAPYFHNGMIWDLKEAIKEMGKVQVGYKVNRDKKGNNFSVDIMPISLNDREVNKIFTFFKALEGRKAKIEYPPLPKSTMKTARPNSK